MIRLLNKFKNIHFLWLVGLVCFLTFYVPVRYFTNYTAYIPEWTIPIFMYSTMIPLWFHEFLWRTARIGSDSYNAFHDLHFYEKKWKKLTCNPFYFIIRYYGWLKRKPMFWVMTLALTISLLFGFMVDYSEYDFHPFTPFYIVNSIWWVGMIKDFVVFRNDAKEGLITYEIYND